MANEDPVKMLVESTAEEWNEWRELNRYRRLEISGQDLGQMRHHAEDLIDSHWADFRDFEFGEVNLRSCKMDDCDLSGAKLHNVEWRDVSLVGSIMRRTQALDASFIDCMMLRLDANHANFSRARFQNSILHDANLSDATLDRADFANADLTGASVDGCDLRSTNLRGASLACANLTSAKNICGALPEDVARDITVGVFGGSEKRFQEWEFNNIQKYGSSQNPEIEQIENLMQAKILRGLTDREPFPINNVDKLRECIHSVYAYASASIGSGGPRLYYRGHACKCWTLTSSLSRMTSEGDESEMLDELTVSNPNEFMQCRSELERLVLARHHGLPTRFLDVTLNPLVALYFACSDMQSCDRPNCDGTARLHCLVTPPEIIKRHYSDTVSVLSAFARLTKTEQTVLLTERPKDGCYTANVQHLIHPLHFRPSYSDAMVRLRHFVAREKPYFENRIDPKDLFKVFVVEPERTFPRLRAQSGAFLMSAYHEIFDAQEIIATVGETMPIYGHLKIDIPPASKASILSELAFYHVNEETMFLGLEAASRVVAARHAKP